MENSDPVVDPNPPTEDYGSTLVFKRRVKKPSKLPPEVGLQHGPPFTTAHKRQEAEDDLEDAAD